MKQYHQLSSCTNTKRENTHKGEKNTISASQCSTAVRQSVKTRSLSASTLTSNQTLTLLKNHKKGTKYKEKGKEAYKHQKQNVLSCVAQSSSNVIISVWLKNTGKERKYRSLDSRTE